MRLLCLGLLWLALPLAAGGAGVRLIGLNDTALTGMGSHAMPELEARFGQPARQTAEWVASLEPGVPIVAGATTIVPLVSASGTAGAAFAAGASGEPLWGKDPGTYQMPLSNAAGQARYALLGQVLEGPYTQDRLTERSFLVEPAGSAPAAIFCCEERYQAVIEQPLFLTRHFGPADLRTKLLEDFQEALISVPDATTVNRWSDVGVQRANETQRHVWREIAARLASAGIQSPYGAYMDLVRAHKRWSGEAGLPPDTCGIVFGVGSALHSIECLPSAAQFRETGASQIVASHLATAAATSAAAADPSAVISAWNRFRASIPAPHLYLFEANGDVTLHVRDRDSAGAILTREGAPIHLFFGARGR